MAVTVQQLWVALNLGDENTSLDAATTTRLTEILAASQARVEKGVCEQYTPRNH